MRTPTTRTIRGISSEVAQSHDLPKRAVISCDNLMIIPTRILDREPAGRFDPQAMAGVDRALRYALDILH